MTEKPFRYLSLGAGVQSTALYVMSTLGMHDIPLMDCAIFADTQCEPDWVYRQLDDVEAWSLQQDHQIPIHRVTAGDLAADSLNKDFGVFRLPAFTKVDDGTAGPLRRQCTREYKIAPIQSKVRELLGYKPRQRIKHKVECYVGISFDEIGRVAPSRDKWIGRVHPLVWNRIRRGDCIRLLDEHGLTPVKKSSCIFCPYHGDDFWLDLKENHPKHFEEACKFDEGVRNMSRAGVKNQVYLHRSLIPLRSVEFKRDNNMDLFDEECAGVCGV